MVTVVFTKNKTGEKADEAMETLEKRRRRFYGDDVADDAYVIAISSLPGPFSTAFFEMKDANDMYRVIYDVLGEVRDNSYKKLNKKYCIAEKLYAPNAKTTTAFLLDDYAQYPRINYGTGRQFKYSRQNDVISGVNAGICKAC